MAEERDLRDLIGEDVSVEELERLRRVHEILLAAGPPPELSPTLQAVPHVDARHVRREGAFSWLPRRRLGTAFALATCLGAIAFGAGYFAGEAGKGFERSRTVVMRGTAVAPRAVASIEIGKPDSSGNTEMVVHVRGLPAPATREYYELYLTKDRKPVLTCGTFTVGKPGGTTTVRLSIPYSLKHYDGWIVSRERVKRATPGPVVLTTFV